MGLGQRLMVMGLMLAVLAGCGPVPAAGRAGAVDEGQAGAVNPEQAGAVDSGLAGAGGLTTVRVAVGSADPVWDALIEAFQEANPGYRVVKKNTWDAAGSAGMSGAEAYLRAGEVDVVPVAGIGPWVAEGLLLDLTPYLQQDGLDLAPFGPLLASTEWQGKPYALPTVLHPQVLVYNREMARAAGVTIPADKWTWDEFRAAARALTHGEGEGKVWGFAPDSATDLALLWLEGVTGGQAARAERAEVEQALRFFQTMIVTDRSMPGTDQPLGTSREVIAAEKAAMGMVDLRMAALLSPAERERFGLAPMPSLSGRRPAARTYVESYGLAASSPAPRAAWAFLKFMAGPEGARILAEQGHLPAYLTADARMAWRDQPGGFVFDTTWLPPSGAGATREGAIIRAQVTAFGQVFAGEQSPENALAAYEQAVQAALAEYTQAAALD
jgi:multiple sugar transport system substrate-binding protein